MEYPVSDQRHFAAAIFDFDETIVDLERQHTRTAEELCRLQGSEYASFPESLRNRSGIRLSDEVGELRSYFGWTLPLEDLMRERSRIFLEEVERGSIAPMPGAVEAIRRLHAEGLRLAIASSGIRDYIEIIVARLGVEECFREIVTGDEVRHPKPDPEAYLLAAERLGIAPARCIAFDDSSVGVRAASAAGMFCVGMRNPRARIQQDLSAADLVVHGFGELDLDALISRR